MKTFENPKINAIIAKSSPSLSRNNIEIVEVLGSGNFGVVHEIVAKHTFALKHIYLKKLVDDLEDEDDLCEGLSCAYSEFDILRKNYPNVVRSYQCHFDKEKSIFSFTMDSMMQKDLGSLIQKKGIPFKEFYNIFQDIVTGKDTCMLGKKN